MGLFRKSAEKLANEKAKNTQIKNLSQIKIVVDPIDNISLKAKRRSKRPDAPIIRFAGISKGKLFCNEIIQGDITKRDHRNQVVLCFIVEIPKPKKHKDIWYPCYLHMVTRVDYQQKVYWSPLVDMDKEYPQTLNFNKLEKYERFVRVEVEIYPYYHKLELRAVTRAASDSNDRVYQIPLSEDNTHYLEKESFISDQKVIIDLPNNFSNNPGYHNLT